MESNNTYDGIDPYAIRLIRYKSKQLVGHYGFKNTDREDIEQELVCDLIQRLPKFNPELSSKETYIKRLVDHQIAKIIEYRSAERRDYRRCDRSLNEEVLDCDNEIISLSETIDEESVLRSNGRDKTPRQTIDDLSIDLRASIQSLPAKQREICERLLIETVTEIAGTGVLSRSALYEMIRSIRSTFESQGLKKYLKNLPDTFKTFPVFGE